MDGAPSNLQLPSLRRDGLEMGVVPSPWISAAEFVHLRADPRLPAAVGAFATSLIELYEGNALMNALFGDRGRVVIGFFVLYLDTHPLPGRNECGATLSAVQTLCRATGLCSAGRAASVLATMRFGRYITQKRDPNDRRRRILVPTQRLIGITLVRWERQFEAMALVHRDAALVPARLAIPAYRAAFLYQLGGYFLAGFRVLDHVPVLAGLAESNAALLLLSSLAIPQLSGTVAPGKGLPISISALSRRFCVSRAHVRNVLRAAVDAEVIAHVPGSEEVVVLPALVDALIQFYGVLFLIFDCCAAAALRHGSASPDALN